MLLISMLKHMVFSCIMIKMIVEVLNDIIKGLFRLIKFCINAEGSIYLLGHMSHTLCEFTDLNIQGILIQVKSGSRA